MEAKELLCYNIQMIYLDHAAATPLHPQAYAAMEPFWREQFFNPSAPYLPAKHVRETYQQAKADLAHVIGAKAADLVITAGATESINLAFTAVQPYLLPSRPQPVILYTSTEHDAVRAAADYRNSYIMPGYQKTEELSAVLPPHSPQMSSAQISVDRFGRIDLADLRAKITPQTVLISVALANNELGTIQPLADISALIQAERQHRLQTGNHTPLYLHSDASQALSLVDIKVARLGVDLLTLNAAKVGGPKGIGALYVAHGVKLQSIVMGGGQEQGLRSGTENVPAMLGFATAATEAKKHLTANRRHYQQLVSILKEALQASPIPPVFLGHPKSQLANFCPVAFPGIDAERLIYKLEQQSVYLSTGAACAASKGQKSHVLRAIGLSEAEIAGSLRISLGVLNNEANVKQAGQLIVAAVATEVQRLKESV